MSARRREVRAGGTRAPPARWNGTSALTVPGIWTCAVLVMLPLTRKSETKKRRALAVDDDEQQARGDADDHRRDEEREAARPRGRRALEPVTCCGLMLRLGEKR